MLFATMTFDDEDAELHLHFAGRARDLDQHNRPEAVRVLRTLEEALRTQAERVARVTDAMEAILVREDEHRRAT